MVMKYSKNAKGASSSCAGRTRKENYEKWFVVAEGLRGRRRRAIWEKHAMWDEDPVMPPFKTAPPAGSA